MRAVNKYLFFGLFILFSTFKTYSQNGFSIYGKLVNSKDRRPIQNVSVQLLNSNYQTISDKNGSFKLSFPKMQHVSLLFKHLSFMNTVKEFYLDKNSDSLFVAIELNEKQIILDSVTIRSKTKPDTLVRSGKFSIYDFDFFEDKYILLTAEKGLDKAELKLADNSGKILFTTKIPYEAGLAKELYHDYMGFTNVICEKLIYRVHVYNNTFVVFALKADDFNSFIKPIIDTLNDKLIFSDYWKDYPKFNYYNYSEKEKVKNQLITISNDDLLKLYNLEYYYMQPRQKLEARQLADDYKVDKSVMAALMTGFTKSLYYEPLYAPLFILKDTICVFDHYKDMLFHFDKKGKKIDSVIISYNHPKNWHEWKRQMVKDDTENLIYAVYDKNGHKYLKLIDHKDGKDKGRYNIEFHSADKIKIRDGYIYYVYRPFESTQEKFLYRELIRLSN